MNYINKRMSAAVIKNKILCVMCFALSGLFFAAVAAAQDATPSPSPSEQSGIIGGYNITSSIELGVRALDVNGSENKFRSDFNYKNGFRIFDSSFLMERQEGKEGFFDTLLITSSGWSADPSGVVRMSIEKFGKYRFDSNVRRVKYFSNLNNHALNQHSADTAHDFGDFDLTLLPERDDFRVRLGYSFNRTDGTRGYNTRPFSDEFPVTSFIDSGSDDFRAGVEGNLAGFNLSLLYGHRRFRDNARYSLLAPHPGNNQTNNARLATFERYHPIRGESNYGVFNVQRTFAKKLDITGRLIYTLTDTNFELFETVTGRDNSNNIVDLDRFNISGGAKRPQTRGDIGITYLVTDKFRVSNTFTFDDFNISGGNQFFEELFRRNAAGNPLATVFTNSTAYRLTDYRRLVNTIEGDYEFNDLFSFNLGYRFTDRKVELQGIDRTLTSPPSASNPDIKNEESENQTHSLLAGMKIKPMKNWAVFADVEHGEADNAFTRLSNYNFTNFHVRSRWSFNQFSLNLSGILKDNNNPSDSVETPPRDFAANIKSRIFSAHFDWTPDERYSLSTGYTYQQLTSEIDVIVPITIGTSNLRLQGISQFFMRDHYAFFDIYARPVNRVSLFASYRISKDTGQGDRLPVAPQDIITSYPFQLQMPEIRAAFRLTRNIDWNVGYQYFDYKERFQNAQDYRAHLPYTSVTIYFGRKE